jgi:hypothetical protein
MVLMPHLIVHHMMVMGHTITFSNSLYSLRYGPYKIMVMYVVFFPLKTKL